MSKNRNSRTELSIKALRANANMTQQDVADRLGVTKQTVIKWEAGKIAQQTLVIHALAKLFDVDIDDIRVTM